jgi:hypothetical protein
VGIVALFWLPACSGNPDAYFVNPCDSELTVHTHDGNDGSDEPPFKRVALQPVSTTKVDDAFRNAVDPWRVVVLPIQRTLTIEDAWGVGEDDIERMTIVIPASWCPD